MIFDSDDLDSSGDECLIADLTAESRPRQKVDTPIYHERDQTLILFDWDDTLFPTHELIHRWGVSVYTSMDTLLFEQRAQVLEWEGALINQFRQAAKFARRCTIITSSSYPWVHQCLNNFAPKFAELLDSLDLELKIAYASEYVPCKEKARSRRRPKATGKTTLAKYFAMRAEIADFYSEYPEQTKKNVMSFGDMSNDVDAQQAVKLLRLAPPRKLESFRTKMVIFPTQPTMSQLTCRLKFTGVMLAAFALFDGDVQLDLRQTKDPVAELSKALDVPELTSELLSDDGLRRALDSSEEPDSDDAEDDYIAMINVVYSKEPLRSFSGWFESGHAPSLISL
eukprot:TRINITY_DN91144_c0_g1_i1.p1 TRINITY_DN91144_c0_g1~~TRINITY_DN91144_c0_g1_i1.p1  ORF type:complete len:339 (+),score=67.35 TRINITY_DN91144_c0_g1_i1:52-1068(+)